MVHTFFGGLCILFMLYIYQLIYLCVGEMMGRACGMYGGGERCAQGVGGEARGKETIGENQT
jgi:hypothetical protein